MGNAQDPSAPPSPYAPPPEPVPDMGALAPPINTPGLAVPGVDPASIGPPLPPPATPDVGVPPMLALAQQQPPPQQADAPQTGGTAAPVSLGQPQESLPAYTMPSFGNGPVAEAQGRARANDAENKGLAKQYDQTVSQEKMAQNAVSEVEQNQASDMAENMRHGQRELAEIAARDKEAQAADARVVAQRNSDWDSAGMVQKNMTFDPDKYINSMSVGSKILTSIAIGLAAIGSSRSIGGSGENYAQKMLNDSIQHGIDQQKEAYRRAGVNVDLASNAYARARQKGMDDHDATLVARQASIDEHKTAAQVITARYDPSRIAANRDMLIAHLDSESAKAKQQYALNTQAAGATAARDVLNAGQTVFGMGVQAENLALNREQMNLAHEDRQSAIAEKAMAAQAKAKAAEGTVAGWVGVPPTAGQQDKAAELAGTERILNRNLEEMVNFKKDYGNEVMNREELAKVSSTAAQVKVALKDKFGLGVMSASDEKLLDDIARNPTSLGSSDATMAALKHLMQQNVADTDDKMASYGMRRNKEYKGTQMIDERPKEGGK